MPAVRTAGINPVARWGLEILIAMVASLLQILHLDRMLLMDGAMGTELQRRGIAEGECYELWNIRHADVVRQIHKSYVAAGARVLLTNSFQANPAALAKHGLRERINELNDAAVRLAREAIGEGGLVLGSIGPWLNGGPTDLEFVVKSLAGADGILLETRSNRQAFADVAAARRCTTQPVMISIAFRKTGSGCEILTYDDMTPESCAGLAEESGCAALGVNCGQNISLGDVLQIVRRFRSVTKLPLFARPNAGTPTRVGNEWSYPTSPEDFAQRVPELLDAGLSMIGGCCGTTPAHIAAMAVAIRDVCRLPDSRLEG